MNPVASPRARKAHGPLRKPEFARDSSMSLAGRSVETVHRLSARCILC